MNGNVGGSGGAAAPAAISQNPAASSIFARLDPTTKALLSATAIKDPKKAIEDLVKFGLKNAETPDELKVIEDLAKGLSLDARNEFIKNIRDKKSKPDFAIIKIPIPELGAGTFEVSNSEAKDYIENGLIPKRFNSVIEARIKPDAAPTIAPPLAPKSSATPPAVNTPPIQTGSVINPRVQSAESREAETAGNVESAKLDAKRRDEAVTKISKEFDSSRDNITNANLTYQLAKDNPKGFGLLAKPGFDKVVAYLAEQGVTVGGFKIGITDIQGAMRRMPGFSEGDIAAVSKLEQMAVQNQLQLMQYLKGSVSNYEDKLLSKVTANPDDSVSTIQYKSQLVKARAQMADQTWRAYDKYRKSKGGNIDDFQRSDEYSAIRDSYDNHLQSIAKAYSK